MSPTIRDGRGHRTTFEAALVGVGPGPVERRVAGEGERAGFAPRVVSPGLPKAPTRVARASDLTPPQAELVVALVNADRAESGLPLIRLADQPVTPEEPTMAIEPTTVDDETVPDDPVPQPREPLRSSLEVLVDAATAAADAWGRLDAATQASRAADSQLVDAELIWDGARATLEASWRATGLTPVAAVVVALADTEPASAAERRHEDLLETPWTRVVESRSHLDPDPPADRLAGLAPIDEALADLGRTLPADRPDGSTNIPEIIPDEPVDDELEVVTRQASRDAAEAAVAADLEADRARKTAPAAGGGPGPKSPTKQERILALILPNQGSLPAIAAAVGTDVGNVNATLHNAGKRGRLTIAMRDALPAVFAKYTGV
jgi:hypothetical protein